LFDIEADDKDKLPDALRLSGMRETSIYWICTIYHAGKDARAASGMKNEYFVSNL